MLVPIISGSQGLSRFTRYHFPVLGRVPKISLSLNQFAVIGKDVVLQATCSLQSWPSLLAKEAFIWIGREPVSVQVLLALAADCLVLRQGILRLKELVWIVDLAPIALESSVLLFFQPNLCLKLDLALSLAAACHVRIEGLLRFEALGMASRLGILASCVAL